VTQANPEIPFGTVILEYKIIYFEIIQILFRTCFEIIFMF